MGLPKNQTNFNLIKPLNLATNLQKCRTEEHVKQVHMEAISKIQTVGNCRKNNRVSSVTKSQGVGGREEEEEAIDKESWIS